MRQTEVNDLLANQCTHGSSHCGADERADERAGERAGEPFTAADAAVLTRMGPKATAVRASATAAVASVAAAIAAALRRSH